MPHVIGQSSSKEVGLVVGLAVGSAVVGLEVGPKVGSAVVGLAVGGMVGAAVGLAVTLPAITVRSSQ
jgi:hypothetical protein